MGHKEKNKISYTYVIYGLIICHYHSHYISGKSLQNFFGSKNRLNEIKQLLLTVSVPRLQEVHPKGFKYPIKSRLKYFITAKHIQGKYV